MISVPRTHGGPTPHTPKHTYQTHMPVSCLHNIPTAWVFHRHSLWFWLCSTRRTREWVLRVGLGSEEREEMGCGGIALRTQKLDAADTGLILGEVVCL